MSPHSRPRSPVARSRATAALLTALAVALPAVALPATARPAAAQNPAAGQAQRQPPQRRERREVPMDSARARRLYVSNRPEDHPQANFERQIAAKARTDSIFAARSQGVMEFRKVTYKSRVDGLEIPAYLFAPLQKRGPRGHAAMVWVHGGVHGNMDEMYLPFIQEAVQRGYVIVTPDYRGSTGYGPELYNEIDYGGKELDDVLTAYDFLKTLPYVDPERVGIMGWSHGGFITAHLVMRDSTPFKAGAAIVPVTNLIFRLSLKGPGYQRSYATQKGIGGLPFEKPEEYIERSPLYHVDDLHVPILVHVATNDTDVNFVEDQQLVDALRSRKPDLAETKIYVDPPPGSHGGGHSFSRRVDENTLERLDSPEQRDSWNRTWTFFEWWLRPYQDGSKPTP
ncbi:MAG TPA: alpha/beta fold hydrolase [Gemmatimonadaceae bacterium]|nr:alpha/beta fold hydrolase [Gemmatimonadaceae bacterium]